jgi:hypothetical protein
MLLVWSGAISHRDENRSIRIDLSVNNNYCIRRSCGNGYLRIVKLFMTRYRNMIDPCVDDNYCLRTACENGHLEIVEILLDDGYVDVSGQDNYAIFNACRNGHLEIVELLLNYKKANFSAECLNNCLRIASKRGYSEIVEVLCAYPEVNKKMGLKTAILYDWRLVIHLLTLEINLKPCMLIQEVNELNNVDDVIRMIQRFLLGDGLRRQ